MRVESQTRREFDQVRGDADEIVGSGDHVLVGLTMRARGSHSRAETTWTFWQVWTFHDGKVVKGQGYPDRSEALEAAGLSE